LGRLRSSRPTCRLPTPLHDAPPVDTLRAELAAQRDEIASLKAALVAAHERSKDEGRERSEGLERAEDR
jgi:hypothetical protein